MSLPKEGIALDGSRMHYSVGAFIENDGKYLLIERAKPPPGFAGPAGHQDEGESPIEAVVREVFEETGYALENVNLLWEEEVPGNYCSKGVQTHYWYVFEGRVSGNPHRNLGETKSLDWYTNEELALLPLEDVWRRWFRKRGILR
jgi:8-oxo-dGTP pyrophosphatase MutT (NUDIX family)